MKTILTKEQPGYIPVAEEFGVSKAANWWVQETLGQPGKGRQ